MQHIGTPRRQRSQTLQLGLPNQFGEDLVDAGTVALMIQAPTDSKPAQ